MELIPSANEVALARESSRSLAQSLPKKKSQVSIRVVRDNGKESEVVVPVSALKLFISLLAEMAQGNAVTLMPLHAELTTQEAADLLNVSRPFFVKLLDDKKIPYKKAGTHRRVAVRDVLQFKQSQETASESAMDELVAQVQKLKLGYE